MSFSHILKNAHNLSFWPKTCIKHRSRHVFIYERVLKVIRDRPLRAFKEAPRKQHQNQLSWLYLWMVIGLNIVIAPNAISTESKSAGKVIVKVFSLPSKQHVTYLIIKRFQELYPHIQLESSTALKIEGDTQDAAPLMAIAGGTSPDILSVNFRQSDTYIQRGFLYPLDEYITQMSREEFADRVPTPILPVIHRSGPDGKQHYWVMPQQIGAKVLMYRRDLFAAAGLDPERAPQDWEELRQVARQVSNPSKGIYGLAFSTGPHASWSMYSYLCSAGAEVVKELPGGKWRAAFDTPEAVTAFEFVDDLQKEQITKNGKTGPVAYRGSDFSQKWKDGKVAMMFVTLSNNQFTDAENFNPQLVSVGPIPKGPVGKASSEINCSMLGIFAGQKDKRVRDAAWEYIRFFDSPEAHKIYTQTMVERGSWQMLNPKFLEKFGYPELAKLVQPGLLEAFETALQQGTPEPYGKNCQYAYTYMTKPLDQIFFTDFTGMSRDQKRAKIQECLTRSVEETNEKMIGIVPEATRKKQNRVAWLVLFVVGSSFVLLVHKIFQWTNMGRPPVIEGGGSRYKTRMASLLIAPALLLILMWQYYPLLRGSLMAFQNYSVMGGSPWVGISNFADVIFDSRFWLSLQNAFYFCILWLLMGFFPPVLLAVMLQEIPIGKIFYRVLFYLPAVVSGVIILFMWRSIYDPSPEGILNKLLSFVHIPQQKWLQDPKMAMFCVVFPLAWAHLGPGCIIYLAALKGIPDELYEAAEIDGASFFGKLRYIVLPYLKPLLVINLVGATIAGFKSTDAILAMTGGGPNFATHVVGYEIWQRSFLYLQFGHGTAMAWILGVLLLSFTAYQLKILNKVEFRTVNR